MAQDVNAGRRRALGLIAAAGGVGGVVVAVPIARFLAAPAAGGTGSARWIRTVPIDSLREGEPTRVDLVADHRDAWTLEKSVQLGAAWLVRRGAEVLAWSTVCPHLGCAINRGAEGSGFFCPCHDSSFDASGRRLDGPSPRDLDSLETRIDDGVVFLNFRRFRRGIPTKEPVG